MAVISLASISSRTRKSLCPILCPTVPKIVPFPRTAADHLKALGGIFQGA